MRVQRTELIACYTTGCNKATTTVHMMRGKFTEKALPLFHDCLQEAENLDRLNPRLDVSREKVGKCRSAVWAAYAEASREGRIK